MEIGLVLLAGFLTATFVLALATPLPQPGAAVPPSGARRVADIAVFERFDPFRGNVPAVQAPAPETEAAETSLDLSLLGTFVGDPSSAIIRGAGRREKSYFTGEEIAANLRLAEVSSGYVILDRNGLRERLSMERRSAPSASRPTTRGAAVTASPSQATILPSGSIGQISELVRAQPNPDGPGVVLFAGPRSALFETLGFSDGDVLVAVNNRPVPSDAAALANTLRGLTNGPVDLVVERDGTPTKLSIDLSEYL